MLRRLWSVLLCGNESRLVFGQVAVEMLLEELVCFSAITEERCKQLKNQNQTETVIRQLGNEEDVLEGSTLPGTQWKVASTMTAETMANKLTNATYCYPMVFKQAMQGCSRDNLEKDLTAGMRGLGLRYFPDVGLYVGKHPKVHWSGTRVVKLYSVEGQTEMQRALESLTSKVKVKLGTAGVMFEGVIKSRLNHINVFPWIQKVSILPLKFTHVIFPTHAHSLSFMVIMIDFG